MKNAEGIDIILSGKLYEELVLVSEPVVFKNTKAQHTGCAYNEILKINYLVLPPPLLSLLLSSERWFWRSPELLRLPELCLSLLAGEDERFSCFSALRSGC
jgi:hypothetical protein